MSMNNAEGMRAGVLRENELKLRHEKGLLFGDAIAICGNVHSHESCVSPLLLHVVAS